MYTSSVNVLYVLLWASEGGAGGGGVSGGIGPPHSKIWGGAKYVLPPTHEICINKCYIY